METEAMDVQQQGNVQDRVVAQGNHVHTTQPQATSKPEVTGPVSAEIVHNGSNESLTDGVTSSDDALLLPDHIPPALLAEGQEGCVYSTDVPSGVNRKWRK